MLKVGLTGGIGCGKSSAVHVFREQGIPVIDADKIARDVVEPGEPALNAIAACFGDGILDTDGRLNREVMRRKVFSDEAALQQLEAIIHPVIRQVITDRMATLSLADAAVSAPYVVVDVPLLFEKDYAALFDCVVVIDCLPEQQIARALQRDGSREETIRGIMDKQVSRAERLRRADEVVDNTTTISALQRQVIELHNKFSAMTGS